MEEMKYLKSYALFENNSSFETKAQLVDKIKFYSEWVRRYIQDYNRFTSSNLNMHFSYLRKITTIDDIY